MADDIQRSGKIEDEVSAVSKNHLLRGWRPI
jgi:hypothetical protein